MYRLRGSNPLSRKVHCFVIISFKYKDMTTAIHSGVQHHLSVGADGNTTKDSIARKTILKYKGFKTEDNNAFLLRTIARNA